MFATLLESGGLRVINQVSSVVKRNVKRSNISTIFLGGHSISPGISRLIVVLTYFEDHRLDRDYVEV